MTFYATKKINILFVILGEDTAEKGQPLKETVEKEGNGYGTINPPAVTVLTETSHNTNPFKTSVSL